jgi:anti-anti-sigma regulatory factor
MFRVDTDKSKNLITMIFAGRLGADQMQSCVDATKSSLADMETGFYLLTDLSNLEFMDVSCAIYIEQIMDLCNARGVRGVIRVVPDPHKDIGYHLMSLFHYGQDVEMMEYENLGEAMRCLTDRPVC